MFELGNPAADLLALKWIRKRYTPKFDSSVVVYGSALNVFHASSKLIRLGIAAQRIVAVIPELAIYLAGVDDQVVRLLLCNHFVVVVVVSLSCCCFKGDGENSRCCYK